MDILTGLVERLHELSPTAIYIIAGALLAAEVGLPIGLFVPAGSIMLTLGLLARTGYLDLATAIAVAVAAALVGDSIGYWEGRLTGHRVRRSRLGRIGHWQRAQRTMGRFGGLAITLGRWTAFVRTLVPRLAGASGVGYVQFLAYNAAGILVWMPGTILLGYTAGQAAQRLPHLVGVAVLTAVAVAATLVARRRLRTRRGRNGGHRRIGGAGSGDGRGHGRLGGIAPPSPSSSRHERRCHRIATPTPQPAMRPSDEFLNVVHSDYTGGVNRHSWYRLLIHAARRHLNGRRGSPLTGAPAISITVVHMQRMAVAMRSHACRIGERFFAVIAVCAAAVMMYGTTAADAQERPDPTRTPTATHSPSSSCATNPHLCGYPDATNTGIPPGTSLKRIPQDVTAGSGWHYDPRGWITIDGPGTTFSGFDTALNVNVTAANVVVEKNRIRLGGDDSFGVSIRHADGVVVRENQIGGLNAGAGRLLAGVKTFFGDEVDIAVLRNDIAYAATGIQVDAGLIKDNYIHDLGYIEGDHVNGTTSNGGATRLEIRHNTVFNPLDQTDAISLFEDFGEQANRIIDDNLVAGGGYCIYGGQNVGGHPTRNIVITNNRFARIYHPDCGAYGYLAAWNPTGSGNVWSGNVWDETGDAVQP